MTTSPKTMSGVVIADVARSHGVRGELKLRLFNPDSEVLARAQDVVLILPSGERQKVRFTSLRPVLGGALVTLPGVTGRESADALRGARVEVPRASLSETEPGEFYICDLEGCAVELDGAIFGTVERVVGYPTCDCLVVAKSEGGRLEVPLTKGYVARVDVAARLVVLVTIEEL
ncbi:MAG: 16S rRNA processing protein RimM [Myxococcales bacterium]|nr:16S rRNA processing protein RimM [Myxococcales bacterium]